MLEKLKGHLVEDWKQAHKFASVWLASILFLAVEFSDYLPVFKEYLPEDWVKYIAIAIVFARVYKQRTVTK